MPDLKVLTRKSPLAMVQTEMAVNIIEQNLGLSCEIIPMSSQGDEITGELAKHGGKGLFCSALEAALLRGDGDIAVHSLKDMPPFEPEGLSIAALLPREDPRDCLVSEAGWTIAEIPKGALIGTASLRRQRALKQRRPDLRFKLCRGNVQTRLSKLASGEFDAIVLANCGLIRQGLDTSRTILTLDEMLPASTQGIIAIQAPSHSNWFKTLKAIDCANTRRQAEAERTVCRLLEGSCSSAISVHADVEGANLHLKAIVYGESRQVEAKATGFEPGVLAKQVAESLNVAGAQALLME